MYFLHMILDARQYKLLQDAVNVVNKEITTHRAGTSFARCERDYNKTPDLLNIDDAESNILIKLLYPNENVLYLIGREHGKLMYQDMRNNSGT